MLVDSLVRLYDSNDRGKNEEKQVAIPSLTYSDDLKNLKVANYDA